MEGMGGMGGEQVRALEVGQTVRVAPGVSALRLGWDVEGEGAPSGGKIVAIDMDGCLSVRPHRPNQRHTFSDDRNEFGGRV